MDDSVLDGLTIRFQGRKLLEISAECLYDSPEMAGKSIAEYLVEFVEVNKKYFERRFEYGRKNNSVA